MEWVDNSGGGGGGSYLYNSNFYIDGNIYCTGSVFTTDVDIKDSVTLSGSSSNIGLFSEAPSGTPTYLYPNTTTHTFVLGANTVSNTNNALEVNGPSLFDGLVTASEIDTESDKKLKKNIKNIENPINKLNQINGVSFNWKKNNKPSFGVIAQEIETIIPKAVNTNNLGNKTVNYNSIIALLIETCKTQQQSITSQNKKIIELENRIKKLESN